jgi:DNA-binding transcriptional MerR regulator
MVVVPPKLYRVGEVAGAVGLSRQVIHQYTTLGLITELTRTASGQQRLYGPEVFERLEEIRELQRRLTLMEIRRFFETRAARRPAAPSAPGTPDSPPAVL